MTCLLCNRTDSIEIYNDGAHVLQLCPEHIETVFWCILRERLAP